MTDSKIVETAYCQYRFPRFGCFDDVTSTSKSVAAGGAATLERLMM